MYKLNLDRFLISVNGLAVGNNVIASLNRDFIITGIYYQLTDNENASVYPTMSVGITSAAYADISIATLITNNTVGQVQIAPITAKQGYVPAGTDIMCRVSIAGTAAFGGISHNVAIVGYYSN